MFFNFTDLSTSFLKGFITLFDFLLFLLSLRNYFYLKHIFYYYFIGFMFLIDFCFLFKDYRLDFLDKTGGASITVLLFEFLALFIYSICKGIY
jgi:hypothetical protein